MNDGDAYESEHEDDDLFTSEYVIVELQPKIEAEGDGEGLLQADDDALVSGVLEMIERVQAASHAESDV